MEDKYSDILKKKYNAVCLGVDGIITDDSDEIDKRILDEVVKLIKRKIPVIFVAKKNAEFERLQVKLYENLVEPGLIKDRDLARIYVADLFSECLWKSIPYDDIYNGMYDDDIYNGMYDDAYRMVDDENFFLTSGGSIYKYDDEKLKFSDRVYGFINRFKECRTMGVYTIGTTAELEYYIYDDAIGKEILNILETGCRNGAFGENVSIYSKVDGNSLTVYLVENNRSISIKSKTFSVFQNTTGISYNNILDISDEKNSEEIIRILESASLVQSVCVDDVNEENYVIKFANREEFLMRRRMNILNAQYSTYDHDTYAYDADEGIYSLFDKYTGGVIVPMYQWEKDCLPNQTFLNNFWNGSCTKHTIKNSLVDEEYYILRGANTYYYFLSNCVEQNGKIIISKENVFEWFKNYIDFFNSAYDASSLLSNNYLCIGDRRYILGILDNCRNVLLTLLNCQIRLASNSKSLIADSQSYSVIYETLLIAEECMLAIGFESIKLSRTKSLIGSNHNLSGLSFKTVFQGLIQRVVSIMECCRDEEMARDRGENYNYAKDYRPYRELDNFGEIYSSLHDSYITEHYDECESIIGTCYGGMEIPILAKVLFGVKIEHVYFLKQDIYYMDKKKMDLNSIDFNESNELIYPEELSGKTVKLFDDNILTGKTLQIIIDTLCDKGINVGSIHVVRYPTANRLDQMFFGNTTAVNTQVLGDSIEGLLFPSHYTRKDTPYIREDGTIDGYDSFGITDMGLKKIYECLVKNHSYAEGSAVDNYCNKVYRKK